MDIRPGPSLPPRGFPPTRPLQARPDASAPSPTPSPAIDPEVARLALAQERKTRELAWLASLAYEPVTTLPGLLEPHGYNDVEPVSRWLTGTQVFFAIKDRRAVIAFRGSESTLDWIVDFLFLPVALPPRHLGFMMAWWSVRGRVTHFLERHRADFDALELCGHSLGGAVAKVAAFDLAAAYPIDAVLTLGAPRAFWGWGARSYNAKKTANDRPLGDLTRSFVNGSDIVAKVPPWFVGYIHTKGAEPSSTGENDAWFVRLFNRIAAERAAPPVAIFPSKWTAALTPTTRSTASRPSSALRSFTADDDGVVDRIARAYVWGDKYAQLFTHVLLVLVAPVVLYALYLWLLAALFRASAAHPNAGYHKQFFRPTLALPALPLPVRSKAARLAGLGLMSPLLAVGLWLLWPLLMFSWRFAFWVPQTIHRAFLHMTS